MNTSPRVDHVYRFDSQGMNGPPTVYLVVVSFNTCWAKKLQIYNIAITCLLMTITILAEVVTLVISSTFY